MIVEPEHFHLIRLHKRWADRFTILWLMFIVLLFGGCYALFEELHAEAAIRAALLIFLAVLVLTTMIWQAVALGIARPHMVFLGIDPEKPVVHPVRK